MKTKDILLVASGVALGYLIFTKDLFNRLTKATKDVVRDISSDEAISETTSKPSADSDKQVRCELKWEDFAKTARFASKEEMEKSKADYIKKCMLS